MRPPAVPLLELARPVRWLQGESLLRTYLAQRDHCLDLFCRAWARKLADLPEQEGSGMGGGRRRTEGAARPRAAATVGPRPEPDADAAGVGG